jgi:hypothetical protein
MYRHAFGRPPSRQELDRAQQFVGEQSETSRSRTAASLAELAAWRDLAHVLLNHKEFLFLQ